MGIFGFKSKKGELLNHWIAFVDDFQFPPLDFYSEVEKQLEARKIPGMEVSRIEYAEGGLLSGRRIYLRMIRERLAFDVCAAPFGETYFFSLRSVELPSVIEIWHLLVVIAFFGGIYFGLFKLLGLVYGGVALGTLLLGICYIFRNAVSMGLSDLDATLIRTPIIGPIYENWFRKETYYRIDTRLMYLEAISQLIRQLAQEAVGGKGLKLTRQYEQAPILGRLYKRVKRKRIELPP